MDNVTEAYLIRQIDLLRAAEGDSIKSAKAVDKLHSKIISLIEKKYSLDISQLELNKLIKEVVETLAPFYKNELPSELVAISEAVAAKEIAFNKKTISSLTGIDAREILTPKTKEAIKNSNVTKISGKTFNEWIAQTYTGYQRKVTKTLNDGIINGESIIEVVQKVKSINKGDNSNTKTIVRSYFMNVAAESKKEVFDLNPDIIEGRIWNSTLDFRTTWDICGVRDQLRWDIDYKPVGHTYEWV